ncbi:MAG: pilus assembly FimT family protein [Bacillota bacterium]
MKNNAGFSLLEVVITISLAGIVLAVMSRTIKTGLEVQSFLADENAALNWTESVLEAYKNKESLSLGIADSNSKFIKNLELLEKESLPKNYKLTKVKISPFIDNEIKYQGLYKLKVQVDYDCHNKERRHEIFTLLEK